jgi:hypothetical protein
MINVEIILNRLKNQSMIKSVKANLHIKATDP